MPRTTTDHPAAGGPEAADGSAGTGPGTPVTGRGTTREAADSAGGARPVPGVRRRLSAEDRRRQLVGIGLMMLRTQPIHELSVDAVAAEAGISRGLLFHYFPTKRDYYVAVMAAAGRRLLRVTEPDPSLPPAERLRRMLLSFVAFVTRRRDSYISFVRGAAGGDPYVVEVYAETRAGLTTRVLDLLDAPGADEPASRQRITVHAWLAYVEDLTIEWSGLSTRSRPSTDEQLVDEMLAALHALRELA